MDEVYLWKLASTLNYENIVFIVQCVVGIRLIFLLLDAWSLIYDERESKSWMGQINSMRSGKILKIRWDIVHQAIMKWAGIFIIMIFHEEILRFVLR